MLNMFSNTGRHWEAEEIERYSLGTIPEEESARLEEHLLICESCRQRLSESDDYVSSMQHAAAELRRAPAVRERRWWWWSIANLVPAVAVLVLLVIVVAVGLRMGNPGPAAPAVAVSLAATRGAGIEAKAPAHNALTLHVDLTGLPVWPSYRLELVDSVGQRVWQGPANAAKVPPLRPGIYFIRAYSPAGELLREYGLEVDGAR